MEIVKPKDLIAKNTKILIYGRSGSGKTHFSTGGGSKTLVFDLEKGTTSAQSDVDVIPINDMKTLREAFKFAKEEKDHEVVVLDSITRFSEMLFVDLKKQYPEKRDSMNLWSEFDATLRQANEALLKIEKHIVVTALEEDIVTESGYIQKHPMIKAKKFKQMLPSYFDLVLYLTVIDEKRAIVVKPYDIAITKNRFGGKIPDIIFEDDELFNVYNLINHIKEAK